MYYFTPRAASPALTENRRDVPPRLLCPSVVASLELRRRDFDERHLVRQSPTSSPCDPVLSHPLWGGGGGGRLRAGRPGDGRHRGGGSPSQNRRTRSAVPRINLHWRRRRSGSASNATAMPGRSRGATAAPAGAPSVTTCRQESPAETIAAIRRSHVKTKPLTLFSSRTAYRQPHPRLRRCGFGHKGTANHPASQEARAAPRCDGQGASPASPGP